MKNMKITGVAVALIAGVLFLSGCGKVSNSQVPLSPLYQVPAVDGFETSADAANWILDNYAQPSSQGAVTFSTLKPFEGAGSLQLNINFTQVTDKYPVENKTVAGSVNLSTVNFQHKTLSIWAYWDEGLVDSTGTIQGSIYMRDNLGTYINGSSYNLKQKGWTQLIYVVDTSNDNPSNLIGIQNVGVQIYANSGKTFSPGIIYLDDFGIE